MKRWMLAAALVVLFGVGSASAAGGLSGTWTSGAGSIAQTFVFKVHGDWFTGVVCGPCDDPASVFEIEDGHLIAADKVAFAINYDVGGPEFGRYGPYREEVIATLSGNQLTMQTRSDGGKGNAVTTVLRRVVDSYEGVNPESVVATMPALSRESPTPSPIEGRWVAMGRNFQQNFILKVRGNRIWGLVCGPCNPDGVFMIDDGTFDRGNITFYINHLDTPPSAARRSGLTRNIMRGTLVGNVMKFKWVREGAEDQPGVEMMLIGPIR
jgi:hypothetical protein